MEVRVCPFHPALTSRVAVQETTMEVSAKHVSDEDIGLLDVIYPITYFSFY